MKMACLTGQESTPMMVDRVAFAAAVWSLALAPAQHAVHMPYYCTKAHVKTKSLCRQYTATHTQHQQTTQEILQLTSRSS